MLPYHRILSRLVELTSCLSVRLVIVFQSVIQHPELSRKSEENRGKRHLDGLIETRSRSFPIFEWRSRLPGIVASFFEFSRRVVSSNLASCKMDISRYKSKVPNVNLVSITNSFVSIVLDRDHLRVLFASVSEIVINSWNCIGETETERETAIATHL